MDKNNNTRNNNNNNNNTRNNNNNNNNNNNTRNNQNKKINKKPTLKDKPFIYYNRTKKTLSDNKTLFFIIGIILLILLFFLIEFTFNKRTTNIINEYKHDLKFKKFEPMKKCIELPKSIKRNSLNEYYIMASYNSLLVGNQKRDYLSINMLGKILETGVRYLEVQIVPSDFTNIPSPVVGVGELEGNWSYSLNTIKFESFIKFIKKNAFTKNINHPLFIYLNFKSLNPNLINKVGEQILCSLKNDILNNRKYNSQGFNLANEDMCNLNSKIVFLSSLSQKDYNNTQFEKVVISNSNFLINRLYYKDISKYVNEIKFTENGNLTEIGYTVDNKFQEIEEHNFKVFMKNYNINPRRPPLDLLDLLVKEFKNGNLKYPLRHFNKFGITIVYPHTSTDTFTSNFDYRTFMKEQGCQIISMNFQENDKNIENYLKEYHKSPIILKPDNLRYIPEDIETKDIITSQYEETLIIPDYYKLDLDLKSYNKIFKLVGFNGKYLQTNNRNSVVKFTSLGQMTNTNYNFMIFGNLDIPQTIMISPIDRKVPVHYLNRYFLKLFRNQGNPNKGIFKFDKININNNDLGFKDRIDASFNALKAKNENNDGSSFSLGTINEDIIENVILQDNSTLNLYGKTSLEEELNKMTFSLQEVKDLKMYIYIGFKSDTNYTYYLKFDEYSKMIKLERLDHNQGIENILNDNHRFEVIPNIGDRDIFNSQKFKLKAANNKYLVFKCDPNVGFERLFGNESDETQASNFNILINSLGTETIQLFDTLEKDFTKVLTYNNSKSLPIFKSKFVTIQKKQFDNRCVVIKEEKLDKNVKIKSKYYTLKCLLEYK